MLEKKVKNSNIPYTKITKEVWLSLVKTLENEQIGEIITAMYEYIYEGKEPHFNSKVMNGQWDMLIENAERMSKEYFNKVDNAKASAQKRIENKKNNSNSNIENKAVLSPQNDSNDNLYQPVEESGSEELKTANNNEFEIISSMEDNSIYDNYEEEVYDLLDSDDGKMIKSILEKSIDYLHFENEDYELFATNGNSKITEILNEHNITGKALEDFNKWAKEFNNSYYINKKEYLDKEEYAA